MIHDLDTLISSFEANGLWEKTVPSGSQGNAEAYMKFGKEKGMVIRMKMLKKKELIMGCVTAACMIAAVWCNPAVALANSEGTVTAKTAYIREKPDTDSEVIGML